MTGRDRTGVGGRERGCSTGGLVLAVSQAKKIVLGGCEGCDRDSKARAEVGDISRRSC